MLGKLIKHEFRATGRIMLPLFAIVLFVSCLAHFAIKGLDRDLPQVLKALLIVILVLFAIGLMAVSIMAIVTMVRRFRSNVLGDEGYLTMTLPASVHSVVWSKIIVSVVWFAATVIVVGLSFFVLFFRVEFMRDLLSALWNLLQKAEGIELANAASILGELLVNAVLYGIAVCLSIYSALSIGHGFARHKMLLSVVAFFALNILFSYLLNLIFSPAMVLDVLFFENFRMSDWHIAMAISAGVALIQGAVYYCITVWNLRHRLNLE